MKLLLCCIWCIAFFVDAVALALFIRAYRRAMKYGECIPCKYEATLAIASTIMWIVYIILKNI